MKLTLLAGFTALSLASQCFGASVENVVEANNQFGLGLFSNVLKAELGTNVFISPLSASMALSMLYNGATGSTKTAMEQTMKISGISLEQLNSANENLLVQMQRTGGQFTLNLANSAWVRNDFPIESSYVLKLQESYQAEVAKLDFGLASSSKTINDWVSQKTNAKITEIVPEVLPSSLKLILINATYFKADWAATFPARQTRDGVFKLADGTTQSVSMMYNGHFFTKYYADQNLEAIELPYKGNSASMIVILPKSDKMDEFTAALPAGNLSSLEKSLDGQAAQLGTLMMPKFSFSYRKELNQALVDMGMGEAFSEAAKFDGISGIPLSVSDVLQKTYVAVDEKGTEAAAVTAIGVGASSVPQFKFHMVVDRPFIIAIRDNQTGALLFLGRITDPKAK